MLIMQEKVRLRSSGSDSHYAERLEGIEAGTLKLADAAHEKVTKASNPYGDGEASRRIADGIVEYFRKRRYG